MIRKAAVIGAGLGGLSAAIRLAAGGIIVDVYEKNLTPGGKANILSEKGFTFDTGPSLLTMPFILEDLFKQCGKNLADYVSIKKLEVLCKYFYPDGTEIIAHSDLEKFSEEIGGKTSDPADRIKAYLNYSKKIYDRTAELFLFNNPSSITTFLSPGAFKTLLNIKEIDPFRSMHDANASFFHDPKTIQLFDRYATYNGSNPYKAPATLNIIQHVEYNLGGYIAEDGIYSIVEALVKLAKEMGVNFKFETEINAIRSSKKKIIGLETEGKIVLYDHIISNADVNFTYKNLLSDEESDSALKYSQLEPSSSALVFYWGVKGSYGDLEIHNILFSEDYFREFNEIFDMKKCPSDPTIYIYISSKFNQSHAPMGFENWFVMINTPYIEQQNWANEIRHARNNIIKKINSIIKIDIEPNIVYEKIMSPEILQEKTSSFRGSIYGISSNTKFAAFLRHPNRSKHYKGLYFCGGSAHPGGGIPLVLLSGKFAAEEVLKNI